MSREVRVGSTSLLDFKWRLIMWIGMVIGFGLGMTITTVMYGYLLMKAARRANETSNTVESLLIRKAEACERMADALENKI